MPQPYRNLVLFEALDGGREVPIALDYSDKSGLDEAAAAEVGLYFKMQYDSSGYAASNVMAGGYVPGNRAIFRRLRLLRAIRWLPPGGDVYARFGLRHGADRWRRAVDLIASRPELTFVGGLTRYEGGPRPVSYRRYLVELARARICVDIPGRGDLCFRLIEALAIGVCVVRPPRAWSCTSHSSRASTSPCAQRDLSDLGDLCARLVRNDRRTSADRSRRTRLLRPLPPSPQLASYYLHEILRVAGARADSVCGRRARATAHTRPGARPCPRGGDRSATSDFARHRGHVPAERARRREARRLGSSRLELQRDGHRRRSCSSRS